MNELYDIPIYAKVRVVDVINSSGQYAVGDIGTVVSRPGTSRSALYQINFPDVGVMPLWVTEFKVIDDD